MSKIVKHSQTSQTTNSILRAGGHWLHINPSDAITEERNKEKGDIEKKKRSILREENNSRLFFESDLR